MRRNVMLMVGAAAVATVATGTIWVSQAEAARSKVEVLIGPDAFSCKNPADVTIFEETFGVSDDFSYPVPALKLNKDLDCTFSFIINNTGDIDVSLTGLSISLMGNNGTGAHMPRLTRNLIEREDDGSVDANFTLDEGLAAGDAVRISSVVERIPGCMGVGGSTMTVRTPVVTLSARGLSGTVAPQGASFALLGTPDSSCDQ